MDKGFFASRQFVIAAVVATLILGAAAASYALGGVGPGGSFSFASGCEAPVATGRELAAAPEVVPEDDGRRRTVTYTLADPSYASGALDLCIVVGEILVEPSPGPQLELVFVIEGDSARAVEATVVDAAFRDDGGRLRVGAWEPTVGREGSVFGGSGVNVRLTVRVPDNATWELHARADVGDVRASGLMLSSLNATTDVGEIVLTELDLQGNASVRTDVGDIILALVGVRSGNVTARADVGDVEVRLPSRADVGYDAHGATDVGQVEIRIGPVEEYDGDAQGPSEEQRARTAGYAEKPTRVGVEAIVDVGDVRIVTA